MNEGFQYIDIIVIAMVAAFLVLRLRSVLGRRTGEEKQRFDPTAGPGASQGSGRDNVVDLPGRGPMGAEAGDGTVAGGLTQIQLADSSFEPNGFIEGAQGAFKMILSAYANGEKATLKPLLAGEVYQNFARAIDERDAADETMETELISMKSVDITEARMDGTDALVTVTFKSEQVNIIKNSGGEIIDGDPNAVEQVTDIWTFRRDTTSGDPNWELLVTRVPDEA
ncbi:MAG: Tim44/TimA family putative adaptor protein [Rhodospirillum sp.]|nr:Tim44/TimA family putative adaptor protein [Rhodospirillum sp.]MCF8491646.1 Tim44/TimA family putative adaptor protein [Rhodospirillum sp.]MCF8501352.1 Tim44/TimA family putative adaptor protein [Rhodospirillum sp.]